MQDRTENNTHLYIAPFYLEHMWHNVSNPFLKEHLAVLLNASVCLVYRNDLASDFHALAAEYRKAKFLIFMLGWRIVREALTSL